MTLDTLIETGKILSYSEGESYEYTPFGSRHLVFTAMIIFKQDKKRAVLEFAGGSREDVTQQVINHFKNIKQ